MLNTLRFNIIEVGFLFFGYYQSGDVYFWILLRWDFYLLLSSPRAESARAATGRRCPHSGRGEDFLNRQPDFFTETAVTPERKVEKSFPRWEINRHDEG